jgi:protein TonB
MTLQPISILDRVSDWNRQLFTYLMDGFVRINEPIARSIEKRLPYAWRRPLFYTLVLSIIGHIIFLAIRWHDETEEQRRLKTPLSVVLVNARTQEAPADPKRLAQADLNGGGQSTNTYASAIRRADPQLAEQLEKMQVEQQRLLSQLQDGKKNASTTSRGQQTQTQSKKDPLEAELAKRIQEMGMQPRRMALTATSAKAVVFAQYYDAMRKQIEAYGTTHFPRAAGRPLYGSLVMMVSVDAQGKLLKDGVMILKSSGNPELDRQAQAIIRAAAPFGRFTDAMKQNIDVLDWVSTFDFTRSEGEQRLDLKQ